MAKWQGGKRRSFLMHVKQHKPIKSVTQGGPRTMLGAAPKSKHAFQIACQLPFIEFPIGDGMTSQDVATISGLLNTGG
jgi:hypothetical protein